MITLINNKTNDIIECPIGICWSAIFLGFLVPLSRGDKGYALTFFVCGLMTMGISNSVLGAFYNYIYINQKLEKGYIGYRSSDINYIKTNALVND